MCFLRIFLSVVSIFLTHNEPFLWREGEVTGLCHRNSGLQFVPPQLLSNLLWPISFPPSKLGDGFSPQFWKFYIHWLFSNFPIRAIPQYPQKKFGCYSWAVGTVLNYLTTSICEHVQMWCIGSKIIPLPTSIKAWKMPKFSSHFPEQHAFLRQS